MAPTRCVLYLGFKIQTCQWRNVQWIFSWICWMQKPCSFFGRTLLLIYSIHLKYIRANTNTKWLWVYPNPSDCFKNKGLRHRLLKHWAYEHHHFDHLQFNPWTTPKKTRKNYVTKRYQFFLEKNTLPNQNKTFSSLILEQTSQSIRRSSDLPGPIFGLSAPALSSGAGGNFRKEKTQSLVRCQFFGVRRIFVDIWIVSVFFFFWGGEGLVRSCQIINWKIFVWRSWWF